MSPFLPRSERLRAGSVSCFAALVVGALLGCGGATSEPAKEQVSNPLPALTGVTPATILAGTGATTLTLSGSGFIPDSKVRWNDADRTTHYQSAQSLTVDIPASDLASVSVAKLTVVNGAPGGGTSGSLDLPVGYPAPQVSAITPASMDVQPGSGFFTITVTGSGFVPQSSVQLGGIEFGVTPAQVTPTQLVVAIPNLYAGTPGTFPLSVRNPAPGGGTSNTVDFGVIYPVPTISVTSPDSSFTGSAVTVSVTGTGFGAGSRVQWNGQDRPTTFVSTTKLAADIPATDMGSPTVAALTVRNPAPGGTSNPLSYRVVEQAPEITNVSPGFITAGSATTTITLSGTNFRTGATAQWNGATRPAAVVSGTSMTLTLTAADIATPQAGRITVTNPGASGISNVITVSVVSSNVSLAVDRTITLTHADLVSDPQRNVLYASVPSSAGQYADEVVRIDPATGAVTGALSVGSNPSTLAVTDDGQYLYVGLLGAPTIVRVALATLTKDIDIPIPTVNGDVVYADEIQPIPGAPRTIAVSTYNPFVASDNSGEVLFDDATRRTAGAPTIWDVDRITRGTSGSRIYGYNSKTSGFEFTSLVVAPDGLRTEAVKTGVVTGYNVDIEYDGGFVYATDGEVVSVPAMVKVGTIPATGVVRPDAANARVHFLNGPSIFTYHYTQFTRLGAFSDASLMGHTKLVRWGTDGLAVGGGMAIAGGGKTIVILRGGLVAP